MEFLIESLLVVALLMLIFIIGWLFYNEWTEKREIKRSHERFVQMIKENKKKLEAEMKRPIPHKHPEWRGKDWTKE